MSCFVHKIFDINKRYLDELRRRVCRVFCESYEKCRWRRLPPERSPEHSHRGLYSTTRSNRIGCSRHTSLHTDLHIKYREYDNFDNITLCDNIIYIYLIRILYLHYQSCICRACCPPPNLSLEAQHGSNEFISVQFQCEALYWTDNNFRFYFISSSQKQISFLFSFWFVKIALPCMFTVERWVWLTALSWSRLLAYDVLRNTESWQRAIRGNLLNNMPQIAYPLSTFRIPNTITNEALRWNRRRHFRRGRK